jgi:RHS repeat-associated protein
MMQDTFIYDCTPHVVLLAVLAASRYTGKERDTESGNDYFGARYYRSSMGRFMSPDPSGLLAQHPENPQSWNLYARLCDEMWETTAARVTSPTESVPDLSSPPHRTRTNC